MFSPQIRSLGETIDIIEVRYRKKLIGRGATEDSMVTEESDSGDSDLLSELRRRHPTLANRSPLPPVDAAHGQCGLSAAFFEFGQYGIAHFLGRKD